MHTVGFLPKGIAMRRYGGLVLIAVLCSWLPATVLAQDGLSNEQLKRMYDDAVVQLKAAQDRRNDLAHENVRLQARIDKADKDLEQARKEAKEIADATFQARAQRSAFNAFLQENPTVRLQWQLFLQRNLLAPSDASDFLDRDWPLSSRP
jgi:hypothetical protein